MLLWLCQACRGSKWKASCGRRHDYGNRFITMLSAALGAEIFKLNKEVFSGIRRGVFSFGARSTALTRDVLLLAGCWLWFSRRCIWRPSD